MKLEAPTWHLNVTDNSAAKELGFVFKKFPKLSFKEQFSEWIYEKTPAFNVSSDSLFLTEFEDHPTSVGHLPVGL